MKFHKYIICLILTISICVGVTSCYSDTTNTDSNNGDIESSNEIQTTVLPLESENDSTIKTPDTVLKPITPPNIDGADYSIVKYREQDYMVFNDETPYEMTQPIATVEFSSLQEMKNAVTKGTLNKRQKNIIVDAFERDDAGIMICDFDNLYEPLLPDEFSIKEVSWDGMSYAFYIEASPNMYGWTHYCYEDLFYDYYEHHHNNVMASNKEFLDEGKTVIYYNSNKAAVKEIRYSLSIGGKTIDVDKNYLLSTSLSNLVTSDTIPQSIELYIYSNEGDTETYNFVTLWGFTEDPDDSWLLQFGMTPYVEKGSE